MAASSDGQNAIEVVIEKLQEIVDDIQKTNEGSVNRSEDTKVSILSHIHILF